MTYTLGKERMKRFLKLMAVFVYPVFAFDSCSNRDPTYYLDDTSQLIAAWSNDPLTLDYRNESEPGGLSSQLHDIGDFRMNEKVFTGKTGERFFIVQRTSGATTFFTTESERDVALSRDEALLIGDLRQKPWYSGIRGNAFFPYNLIYYFGAMGVIACICMSQHPPINTEQTH